MPGEEFGFISKATRLAATLYRKQQRQCDLVTRESGFGVG